MSAVYPLIFVVLGCPGSGKGTFAQAIQSEGYEHVSIGDIARQEVKNETEFGLKYKDAILNHVLGGIPFEEIQSLVEQKLEASVLKETGIILDGYPKTKEQCEFLDGFIEKKELKGRVAFVLLEVKEEEAIDRILYRQTCEMCSKIYNSKFLPSTVLDQCDVCHGNLSHRLDDHDLGTRKRVYEFKEKMQTVIDYYSEGDRLYVIDGNADPVVCLERFTSFYRHLQNKGS